MTAPIIIEHEYRTIDKSAWPDGPWLTEPDKVQYTDPQTGLPCLAKRNATMGFWCGYVAVAEGHPLFGANDSQCLINCGNDHCYSHTPEALLRVHGGITFTGFCQEGDEAKTICHIPRPGEPDHVYWFGYDAGHANDLQPGTIALLPHLSTAFGYEVYRDLAYIIEQNAQLARQLAALGAAARASQDLPAALLALAPLDEDA